MQQTRQRDSALNHSPRIRVHLLSRPSESLHIVQFYEKDEFLGDEGFERINIEDEEGELFPKVRRDFASRELEALGAEIEAMFNELKQQEPGEQIPNQIEEPALLE